MGRLTEIFFTAHPSCATQQKPRPSPPRKGRGFVYAHLRSLTRAKTHLRTNPLSHIVNAHTTPKNATERLAMRNPPAIEQTKHPRPRMWSGARRFVAQASSKPWLPQVSSPQTHSAPPRLSLLMTSHESMPIYFASFSLIVFWPHAERRISFASP